jgi:hypothetical protein
LPSVGIYANMMGTESKDETDTAGILAHACAQSL